MNTMENNPSDEYGPQISRDGEFYRDAEGRWQPVPKRYATIQPNLKIAKSRGLYIILGLFLGCLGIHNFYAGRFGAAVAQLLITIFLGWLIIPLLCVMLWVLIECIVITEDGSNVKFI